MQVAVLKIWEHTTVLILFKWYLEDNWFVKKDFSYEEKEKEEENDYGYIE